MSALIEIYNRVSGTVIELNEKISKAENKIAKLSTASSEDAATRIAKLEELIKEIDDRLMQIKELQMIAEKNLTSKNVLTIEAPPGYRVNINRLRNWAMLIDPQYPDSPYAQRVYIVSKCDEKFLEGKKIEFTDRIAELNGVAKDGKSSEIEALKKEIALYREQLKQYAMSSEVADFARAALAENKKYWYDVSPKSFADAKNMADVISPGAYALPFSFADEQKEWLASIMGRLYDKHAGRILVPLEISNKKEYVLNVTCVPSKRKELDRGIQNLILATINGNPANTRKVYVLDAVRYNSSSLGNLRPLENTFGMEIIPRNPEQLEDTLESLVASFTDIDEKIELFDSVNEYNAKADKDKIIPCSTVVVYGWPHSFEGKSKELMQKIMTNYERYGVSLVVVDYKLNDKDERKGNLPEYALQNAVQIKMTAKGSMVAFEDGAEHSFTWYSFNDTLSESFIKSVEKIKKPDNTIDNTFAVEKKQFKDKSYREIELVYGVDAKRKQHKLTFENENFATYIVGASRSGKSTLLHTLITGLITDYHPDNVELWLADFKQLEFKKYIDNKPPHIKYILLDESPELIYDLIDKLTEKMLERQRLFAELEIDRINQVNKKLDKLKEPLPVIFVILDEFSIMSQAIEENEKYRIRLQNLLAKGAAMGFKFIFSSQTFTMGVRGLTETAKAQIQQRIAMKADPEEITATLDLSSNSKTEQVRNWMDALPPQYALTKHRVKGKNGELVQKVDRVHVMYIPDYNKRDEVIDAINADLKEAEDFSLEDVKQYKRKERVIVDGNSYESFAGHVAQLKDWAETAPYHSELTGDEVFMNVGTPRRMDNMIPIIIEPETRENVLFISDSAEIACSAAIIKSMAESFRAQGGNVHIWAYGRNRIYRIYKDVWSEYNPAVDMDAICDEIRSLKKKIDAQIDGKDLIIFIGMDRVCSDFEIAVPGKNGGSGIDHSATDAMMSSAAWIETDPDEPDLFTFLNEAEATGLIYQPPETEQEPEKPAETAEPAEDKESGAYDAGDDFREILMQGSRFGYHVVAVASSVADFGQSRAKIELFRHRMSFQIPKDDSWELFGSSLAAELPAHICRYSNMMTSFSFRPYLHKEFEWEGWTVDEQGNAVNRFS